MQAFLRLFAVLLLCAQAAPARELTALARVDPARSAIEALWGGDVQITIGLSQGVPFRIFTLDAPKRLVIDFQEADWRGVQSGTLLPEPGQVAAVRFGAFQPGWSRLVADLTAPMVPSSVDMAVDPVDGSARLTLRLEKVAQDVFASRSGAPKDAVWTPGLIEPIAPRDVTDAGFVVVLDPGHGGVDPGAERDGISEKELMLTYAAELGEALVRAGAEVVLTRDRDVFVSLQHRVAVAHRVQADLFVSLHADSLRQGGAKGATVYLLSKEATDTATAHLAARHNRADLIAGADLSGADDEVTGVLLDLARQETAPRSAMLARSLIDAMAAAGGPMNRRPLRSAGFSVLKSADIPSVLIEVGFLSSERDLGNLRDPVWRKGMVAAIARGILHWRDQDAARAPLVRK